MNFQIIYYSQNKLIFNVLWLILSRLYLFVIEFNDLSVKGQSCSPRISARLLKEIPCDLSVTGYCIEPGSLYPWNAVRSYILENQGFVKKMYGEQRQSQILREEMKRISRQYRSFEPEEAKSKSETESDQKMMDGEKRMNNNISLTLDPLEVWHVNNQSDYEDTTLHHSDGEESTFWTSTLSSSTVPMHDNELIQSDEEEIFEEEENVDEQSKVKGYNACPITQEVVAPYWANNTRGETLALLNVYPFEQYIHWEKCSHENRQMFCRNGCRCEQQFRLHRLLAFDPKNECRGIFADWFRFPGCCVCICYDESMHFHQSSQHGRINNRKSRL